MNPENVNKSGFLHTFAGVPLAFVTWAIIYTLAHVALYLLDMTRGLDDDWLQSIFRELFTPGVGGYVAVLCVSKYLPKANLKLVTIIYCAPIVLLYIFFSLYIIIFQGSNYNFIWGDQITGWGLAIATCIGSYMALNSVNS